jgi:hypothetical protein
VVSNGTIESLGAATVTISGTATNGSGIVLQNAGEIGDATGSGTITLQSNKFDFTGTPVIDGQGALVIEPVTAATTIGLGGGTGTLNLTDAELAFLSDGFSSITIGSSTAGNIDIDTASFADPLTLITGGEIHDAATSPDLNMTGGDTATADGTVAPGQSPGIMNVTGNFTFADGSAFEVEIGGTTAGVGNGFHDQIDATGMVTIGTGVTLTTLAFLVGGGGSTFVPSVGQAFTIINRTGGSGMFATLGEGAVVSANFLGSGLPATISYEGGNGDDVVISMVNPTTDVTLVGNVLTITDADSDNTADNLVISFAADVYTITDSSGAMIDASSIAGSTGTGTATVTVPVGTIDGVNFNTLGGDDAVTVNSLQASLPGGFTITGGTGTDTATINTDIVATVSGAVDITVSQNIALTSGSSITAVNGGITLLANSGGAVTGDFVGIDLNNADITTSGTGAISLTGTGGNTAGDFGIDIRNGSTVTSTGTAATAGGITLSGTGQAGGNDGVHVTGAGASVGSVNGNISIIGNSSATDGVQVTVGAVVESTGTTGDAATIRIIGNGIQEGVEVSGANAVVRSVAGNIDVDGTGTGTTDSDNIGVHVIDGGVIQSTGSAIVDVMGTGGNAVDTGDGVRVSAANSAITTSSTGNIIVNGQGGSGSGQFNRGVRVQGGGTISSTGTGATAGTITVGGTGGASGTSGNHGISVSGTNSLITSVDGNIGLTGQGGTGSADQQIGIVLLSGGQVTSTGTGANAADITAGGTGGTGTMNNFGVFIDGTGGTTTHFAAVDGDVSITGTGGTGGNDNHGVNVVLDGSVQVGTGAMAVIGSAGDGDSNGVRLSTTSGGRLLANGAGTITVTATGAGSGADFQAGSDSLVGDGTGVGLATAASGAVTVNADTIDWQGTLAVQSTGALTIQPRTASTTIGLGGGSGMLSLDDTELGFLQDGFSSITIGKSDAGNIDINTASFADPLTLLTAAEILDNAGTDLNMTSGDTATGNGTVAPGQATTAGVLTIAGTPNGSFAFANSTTFEVEIGGNTPGVGAGFHDQIDATGTVNIGTGVTLSTSALGGFVPSAGDAFEIISRSGGSGEFTGLTEGAQVAANFLGSGLPATISYAGGDGNDVVITLNGSQVNLAGGNLTVSGDSQVNTYIVTLVGANIEIEDTSNPIFAGTGATQDGPNKVTVPAANVTTSITFNGGDGNDSLDVDFGKVGLGPNMDPTGGLGLTFNGGGQTGTPGDTLSFSNGEFTTTTYTYDNLNDGNVDLDGTVFTYNGLEPITSTITAANVILNYSAAAETITISDAGGGSTTVNSTLGEITTFVNPTTLLQINAGDTGVNTINVGALANPYPASIDINGGDGGDSVDLQGSITFAADQSLTVDADLIDTTTATAAITTTGTGSIGLTATQKILLRPTVALSTVNGGITLSGNSAATGSGEFTGVDLVGALVSTSGSGAISITGQGGTDVNSKGVHIRSSSQLTSSLAAGGGTITINGTSRSMGTLDFGVAVENTSLIDSKSGAISITGNGGPGASNHGLFVAGGSDITSSDGSGAATITINATGGSGGTSGGIVLNDADTTITSIAGDINITATGGSTSGAGLSTTAGPKIASLGAANLTITADGTASDAFVGVGLTIGDAAGAGTITLTGDEFTFTGASAFDGSGALIIQPQTAGTDIEIGDVNGTLSLTDAELAFLSAGFSTITIGKADAGDFNIESATLPDTTGNSVTILTAGTIRDIVGAPDLVLGAGDTATLNGTVAPGFINLGAPGDPGILGVTGNVSLPDNTTYEVQIGGTNPGDGNGMHDQIDASGSVTIGANVTLSTAAFLDGGGAVNFVPSLGGLFEIINRTGGTGTFNGLAEGAIVSTDFLSSGFRAQITYAGGDGDDVVLSMLPADVNVNAGALVVNNEAGDINTYIITLIDVLSVSTIQIQDTTSLIFAGTGATQVNAKTVTVPAANVTTSITFNGQAAADSLEVNRTGGDPTLTLGLTWNGGDPAAANGDILSFSNGTVTTTTVNYTDANSGNVDVDGIVHAFTELEDRAAASGITSTLASANVVLNYSTTAETIDISNPGGGSTTVNSAASTSTTFTNPTTQLTINAGDTGDDTVNVTSLAASYPGAISIVGGTGTDTINVNGPVSTNNQDITLAAEMVTTAAAVGAGTGANLVTTDALTIGAAVSGTGTLTIAPQTTTATIGIGGGAGTLNVDDSELGFLADGFSAITIGDTAAGSGTVTIDTATFNDPVTIAGGTINDAAGTDIAAGTNAVTLQGTVAPESTGGGTAGILNVTENLTLAANDTVEIEVGGTSPGEAATDHDQINVTGTVTIGANVTLTTSVIGAFAPFAGDEFIIIDNDGTGDAVTGTFQGLAEGAKIANFLGSGRSATISYIGGDGNDVTLTGDGFFVSIDGAGNMVLTDNAGTNDAVTIQADPGTMEYVIRHATELIGNQVAPFTGTGTMVARVPFAAVTGQIIANFDGGDDSLNVDYATTNTAFGKSITLNGGEAGETNGDKLFITGDGGTTVESGVYTPSNTAESGQHVLTLSAAAGGGTETINFTQLEQSNQVSDVPTYELETGGSNDVLAIAADTVDTIPAATVTGTTDGITITPITFYDVSNFTIDTGANDTNAVAPGDGAGNDSVTVTSGLDDGSDLVRNLTNFTIDTGAAGNGNVDSAITNAVIDLPGSVSINNAETVDLNSDIEAGTSITISNVGTEIDLAQDVDLTAENGDLNLNTNVTAIDLSGAAGTNNLIANDASGDGNISVGPVSDSGTPTALVVNADNAVAMTSANVQSTITVLANQDATGTEGFSNTGTIATTNDTATAVSITVNTGGGGTGNASLGVISTGTTAGPAGGRITVDVNGGAITDGNTATNNLTAGNAILIATAGVGTAADPIETTISRLEAAGGTGGVFVTDADSLTIGGIDAGQIGVSSGIGNIAVRTASGTQTVEENVTSTGTGNILLKTTDTAGVGDDLTINPGVTISTNTGSIDIQAGDNLTLVATSHVDAPGGTIAITSDSGDADAGVGTTLTIAAELDSTGTSINGGDDDDVYDFFYPAGATNSGTATIADTGGTDQVMIHGTAAAEELFLTTADPPTTATTEQVTRATDTAEPVIIPSDIEAVTLLGGDGNDIFHVQPSMLFPVTVNGDNPSFGDAGVPPGDQLDLITFGNSFTINGKTIFVANGNPNPYKGITFLNIETVPLTPASAGPDQSFDFDDPNNAGPVKTQAGFTSVNPDTLFTAGNFGWQRPMTSFETGMNTGITANYINDGHTFAPTSGADTNTFSATVGNGWVMATIAFGSDYHAIVGMQIENADDNTVIASNLSAAARETDHVTILVLVQDGTLDLRFRDPERETNTFRRVSIKGIDLETDGGTGTLGFLSMGFPTPGTLDADGTTIDTFPLSAAEPNSLVTVATTLGTLSGTDADPNIEGFQVLTDGAGTASILIQRPSAAGQALVDLSSVTGRKTGCIVIDYGQVAGRNFDFNANVSATFSPFDATTNPDGYIGVVVDDLFTAERGYGWTTTAPDNFQVTPSIGGSMPELVDDGHLASDARTFRTTLANGTYQVHVTMGAYADHQSKSISANGVQVLDAQTIVNRTLFETIFTTTVTSGQLDLTFSQNDDVFGSNHWIINALEIRPTASVLAITQGANIGDVEAQRTNLTVANTLNFATTAPDGTLMTVSSTLGTITTADADPTTAGTQVAVAGGMVPFDLLPGNKAGTPTIEIHSLDGEHRATVNDAALLNYVVPVTRRFDFNNGTSDPANQSASASGFVGVSLRDQSPATNGFGFNENRMSGVFQSGDIPGVTNDDFYRDGIRREVQGENGRGLTNASFSIEARAGIDYDVRVYLGAPSLNFMNFSVAIEGAGTQTVGSLTLGNFTSLTFPMANDEDGDGFIKISFLDEVAPYDGFGIPGIDIAESASGLPAVAPLLAAEYAAGSPVIAANPTEITTAALATAVEIATIAFLNSDLSSMQRSTLQNMSVSIGNLDLGVLGLADGAVITIDDDGAGAGWSRSLTEVASNQYDLLTVVGHEIGHALGFDDSDMVSDFQDLMNEQLTVGVRHNSLGDIDDFFGAAIFDVTGIGNGPVDPVSASNAITVSISDSGELLIADTSDNGLNQTLTLSTADGVLTISDPGNSFIADAGTLTSVHQVQVSIGEITSLRVVVDLQNGADILESSGVDASLALNITGGAGNDMITGGQGDDTIDGGTGNDDLAGSGGTDTLLVNGVADVTLTTTQAIGDGTDAHDEFERAAISGGAANDRLDASQADMPVTLFGNDGDDTLLGSGHDDVIDGGAGHDVAEFASSNITLTATSVMGAGDDSLISVEGLQLIAVDSGSTIDASAYSGGSVTIVGTSGDDTLTGGAGDDIIIAGSGRDVVSGGDGDDVILGGSGNDTLSGGAGNDAINGGHGRDSIDGGTDDDSLQGGPQADTLKGGGGNDQLSGGAGADVLEGETGDDALVGGAGANLLIGGEGNDTLNNIPVADDFNAPVGTDHLIGGNAPQARPTPVSPAPLTASLTARPATASFSNASTDGNETSTNDREDADSDTLDAAFGDALLVDLLEL